MQSLQSVAPHPGFAAPYASQAAPACVLSRLDLAFTEKAFSEAPTMARCQLGQIYDLLGLCKTATKNIKKHLHAVYGAGPPGRSPRDPLIPPHQIPIYNCTKRTLVFLPTPTFVMPVVTHRHTAFPHFLLVCVCVSRSREGASAKKICFVAIKENLFCCDRLRLQHAFVCLRRRVSCWGLRSADISAARRA